MNTTELGALGETLAVQFILNKGYSILDRNVRFKKFEADIIAQDGNTIVVIEVKTRQTAEIGEPWRAVTRAKQKQIIAVANHYLITNQLDCETRFDIISIVHNSYRTNIEHLEDAFYPIV
jgi:putative endonuclease